MRVLLLAAGRGTRISRYLQGNPKCTVDVNGQPLIQYTVNTLKKKGITEIAVVTGYRHEVIEELLSNQGIKFYYNPFFDVTNSIASAWFARDFFTNDDIIVMNADVFCEDALYDEVLALTDSPVMIADTTRKEEADYKFYFENNRLLKYGKELEGQDITGEYVGIAKMSAAFVPEFVSRLEKMINTQNNSVWWENVLYSMIAPPSQLPVFVHNIAGKFWAEVDYIEDYERILSFLKKSKEHCCE